MEKNDVQNSILKKMSPQQKLQAMMSLNALARKLKTAGIRQQHPGWSDQEVDQAVKEIFINARS